MIKGNTMGMAFIGISIVCAILIIYLMGIKLQLQSIKGQLERRNKDQSKSLVLLELQDKDLNGLTVALNETLKQESDLRVSQEIQEREFKNLVTNISHDLRTPLTVMKGYLQLLARCELDENSREYLNICFRHTDELERRIRQFFEYSYWMNQEEHIALHTVNVTNLIMDTMTDFIPVFEEKGISMKLENEVVCKGLGDEELLKRIMQNILKNCLQYASGEVTVSISASNDPKSCLHNLGDCHEGFLTEEKKNENGKIKISVANLVAENCSIDADKVFQRFYVGNTERNQSTGLGLSIVKLLVEKMQGEVFAGQDGKVFYVGFLIPADNEQS